MSKLVIVSRVTLRVACAAALLVGALPAAAAVAASGREAREPVTKAARARVALAEGRATPLAPRSAGKAVRLSCGCAATPRAPTAPTPDLAKLSRTWWSKNGVWMGVAGAFHGEGLRAFPRGQKVAWYRTRRGVLRLYGKRLGNHPANFSSDVPSGYGRIGFQPSQVTFGAPGCWALTAVVGTQASRFIVVVTPAP